MLQILIFLAVFIAIIFPMGKYLYHIAVGQRTFADPVFDRVDNGIYRICGIDRKEMNWKQYALAMLATNAIMVFVGYLILRIQGLLFLNPNGIGAMEPSLSFNTIISFMTNTNLQDYSGESGLSYLSQMVVIIFMMFTSAATGFSVAIAAVRGFAGKTKPWATSMRISSALRPVFSCRFPYWSGWCSFPKALCRPSPPM